MAQNRPKMGVSGQNKHCQNTTERKSTSRGPKCRLDPLLGPFLVILSHFGPLWAFFDPFWPFGWGATAPSGSGPPIVGVKWGGESELAGSWGPFLVILSHFGSFWALFDPFWPFGRGAKAPSGPNPL